MNVFDASAASDRELLNEAQYVIPCFSWHFIVTEQFGSVAIADQGKHNGFVLMTETEFWLDQKSGQISDLGEPLLTVEQRDTLRSAIGMMRENRLHSVDLVLRQLFEDGNEA